MVVGGKLNVGDMYAGVGKNSMYVYAEPHALVGSVPSWDVTSADPAVGWGLFRRETHIASIITIEITKIAQCLIYEDLSGTRLQ